VDIVSAFRKVSTKPDQAQLGWGTFELGTIFGMSVTGSVTLFRPFSIATGLGQPKNRLLQAADGNFYGTTQSAAFKMSASGVVTSLFGFDALYTTPQ
jgi:hypothetical protein